MLRADAKGAIKMIDMHKLREDPEAFWDKLRGKQPDEDMYWRMVALDIEHRKLLKEVEELRRQRNQMHQFINRSLSTPPSERKDFDDEGWELLKS